jgi:hypothetical protein
MLNRSMSVVDDKAARWYRYDRLLPNGLAFSCRERADHLQKTNDLAREAVNCNAVLAGRLGTGIS